MSPLPLKTLQIRATFVRINYSYEGQHDIYNTQSAMY